jgi:hypothetical protein
MKNLRVYMPLVNNEQLTLEFASGRELIDQVFRANAASAAPRSLVFEGRTTDGRTIRLVIPYSESDPARVMVEERG